MKLHSLGPVFLYWRHERTSQIGLLFAPQFADRLAAPSSEGMQWQWDLA